MGRVGDPGAGGAAAGGADPIFQGAERTAATPRRATLLFQFFLFPLLIVVASVGVFLLFGAIGGADRSPAEHLDTIQTGGDNAQKQAVHQLAAALLDERRKVDAGTLPLEKALYAAPAFRAKLLAVFEDSFRSERTPERQEALARCVGAVGDPASLDALTARLVPATAVGVRRAIVQSIAMLPTDRTVGPLVTALEDPDDFVRNAAVQGLSRYRNDASVAALHKALGDASLPVRLTAASALGVWGDAAAKPLVAQLLDPAWVDANLVQASTGGDPGAAGPALRAASRQAALANGLRAAAGLADPELKPRVEALTRDGDESLRALARDVLDRWGSPR